MLDHASLRAHFPGLNHDWALFDNAGGSVPCRQVIDRVRAHMEERCVQLGASYAISAEASAAVDAGRAAAARLFNASPDELVLGASSTAHVRTLAAALLPLLAPGDEVIVTDLDHEANVGAWRALERFGVVLKTWPHRPDTLRLEVEDLLPLLGERTRLVAFTHSSNIVGSLHDVPTIAARIREAGAWSVVDGVAFAPHRRVDVRALGVDAYFASLYKVFGPHQAALYVRSELLAQLGSQAHFFSLAEGPAKLEPGGINYELTAGLTGIPEYLATLGDSLEEAFGAIAATEAALVEPLLAFLDAHPAVRIVGEASADPALRVPTVSFIVDGMRSDEVVAALDERRLAVRFGHFYAHRLITALGLHDRAGVVRASLVHYNTPGEVARLTEGLAEVLPG